MNKQSDLYVIFYTVALTIICGSLLALASEGLKPYKEANIALDLKKNILGTTMDISSKKTEEIESLYEKLVKASYVVDTKGKKVEGVEVDDINVLEEYSLKKETPEERLLPVYEVASEENPDQTAYYVFPTYGFGLWDYIWGYVALQSDMNTIQGTVFAHRGETAGLGARIVDAEIQERYVGKKIFEGAEIAAVEMQKGEGNSYDGEPHKVDGMSGATLTGKGLNIMFEEYFGAYKAFIEKQKGKLSLAN